MAIADLCYIDSTGFHFPDYPTTLGFLQDEYRSIYGEDIYLEADSQDGQWLAVQALAIYDTMSIAASVYNAFSPSTAQGVGLSRNVKINGISRAVATKSSADLRIVGNIGTFVAGGIAEDTLGQKWNLPDFTIPIAGEIIVTATAAEFGATTAAANTIDKINTPTLGWQTVNNLAAAVVGFPVESDAQLRLRQAVSTSLPSVSVMEGTVGAVSQIAGVGKVRGYENDTNLTNSDTLPPHSISIVAETGDSQLIANAIAEHKTPGTRTYGTTSVVTYDIYGIPNTINFYRPTSVIIGVEITVHALQGYTTGYQDLIKQAVSDHINSLKIGDGVYINRIFTPANLSDNKVVGATFEIDLLRIKKNAAAFGTADVGIAFNELAKTLPSDITIIVV
jgi:uncharacterized phage protein gp47/JayE